MRPSSAITIEYATPEQSKVQLTFKSPAPPGCITVKSRKLDAPPDATRDGFARLHPVEYLVDSIGEFKNIEPRGPTPKRGSIKRQYFLYDRTLAALLVHHKLSEDSDGPGRWTSEALGLLPRFHSNGTLNPNSGHIGRCAWVYVDKQPHILLANSMYALVGDMPGSGSTSALREDPTLPLFSVSEHPFVVGPLDKTLPLDRLLSLSFGDYFKIFVEPRSRAAVEKAKKRAHVDRALRDLHDRQTMARANEAARLKVPLMDRVPDHSPLQQLERRFSSSRESSSSKQRDQKSDLRGRTESFTKSSHTTSRSTLERDANSSATSLTGRQSNYRGASRNSSCGDMGTSEASLQPEKATDQRQSARHPASSKQGTGAHMNGQQRRPPSEEWARLLPYRS